MRAWPSASHLVLIAICGSMLLPGEARASDFSAFGVMLFTPVLLIAAGIAAIGRRAAGVVLALIALPLLMALNEATHLSASRTGPLPFFFGALVIFGVTTGWRLIPPSK